MNQTLAQPSTNEIHLWYVDLKEVDNSDIIVEYMSLLSKKERRRYQRYLSSQHKLQYLTARALLRTLLSSYYPVPPTQWSFNHNKYGKPAINQAIYKVPITFNISHTSDMVICGFTLEHHIGVDIENWKNSNLSLRTVKQFFSASEIFDILATPNPERQRRSLEYWTLKESYIKARGLGLSMPLDQFSFHVSDNLYPQISFNTNYHDHSSHWYFWNLDLAPHHVAAIAVYIQDGKRPTIITRKIIPLLSSTRAC